MSGTLYIVATPIGNLEDITLRALRVLGEVDVILAEDTRVTKKLLLLAKNKNLNAKARLISYHQHSSDEKKLEILMLLMEGKNIALVSDAGTPGISDPGNELISFLIDRDSTIKIVSIPGASAITTVLSISGIKADKFIFVGFWPKKKALGLIEKIVYLRLPVVFYDSPHRILKTLEFLSQKLPAESRVLVAREVTKIHESVYRGSFKEVIDLIKQDTLKGEITAVISFPKVF